MSTNTPKTNKLAKTNSIGDVVAGNSQSATKKTSAKTTPKAKGAPEGETGATTAAPSKAQKASAQVDAQSVLETAQAAIQNLAQHNASQAQRLGVELARAEQAFPLVMMDSYVKEKQALQEAGLDAQTFLRELGEQISGVASFDATVTIATTAQPALLEGSESET